MDFKEKMAGISVNMKVAGVTTVVVALLIIFSWFYLG